MPFRNRVYRPYTKQDVEKLKKSQKGIYALFRDDTVIYIGMGVLRDCLMGHLSGDNACIVKNKPNRWLGRVFTEDPSGRLEELIKEYSPICNKLNQH